MIRRNPLKLLIQTLVFVLLVAVCAAAAADGVSPVNCYWQLEKVEVDTAASDRVGAASATTSIEPLSGLDVEAMMDALRGDHIIALSLDRDSTGKHAQAGFVYSTVPALVPGAAAARLNIAADTHVEDDCFYLYSTVNAGGSQIARVRGTGAWVVRTFFPRQAVPGAKRTLSLIAREHNELAQVRVNYVYTACPGAMIIDTNNDIVLYDLDGKETRRIPQAVEDMLPVMMQNASASSEGDTVFSAEENEDGSVIVRPSQALGLSHEEIIKLIRATTKAAAADASSAATAVSTA